MAVNTSKPRPLEVMVVVEVRKRTSRMGFEREIGLCMGWQPAKKPWLVEVLDCIAKIAALIDVYQRGPNWRGS